MAVCAVVSFRLGMTDGVSIVAGRWAGILRDVGFEIVTVAGEGPVHRIVPGLALGATEAPTAGEVESALADADLVLVENLCTIPMNLGASRAVTAALRGRPAVLHHHDPPWQREQFSHITELPPTDEAWEHVTINDFTRLEFASRGIAATTIRNPFDTEVSPGHRAAPRRELGLANATTLVLHPVRAIARKNVPAAVALTEDLGGVYWLMGEAEDGYDETLDEILRSASCRVIRGGWAPIADAYAACDIVAFPSTWEGFGNPPLEAAIHHRPCVVGDYPASRELRSLGFRWFDPSDTDEIRSFLAEPDTSVLDTNLELVRTHFSLKVVGREVAGLLERRGWLP